MAPTTRIAEIAAIIQSQTMKLDEHLKANGLKSPSFDIDAPSKLSLPPSIAETRAAILDATNELHSLVLGPVQSLTDYQVSSIPACGVLTEQH